ncbi:MAG: prepilin-type N-terminal cleavage/methylation domain-containing protein, partial [Clostridia bacterium]|nr:prepilin-type N-terminal cleavage/methylation domain-containing protein [Clostridia bacterium]
MNKGFSLVELIVVIA